MSPRTLDITATVTWTGNRGQGTASAKAYARDLVVSADGKPDIPASTAPAFGGDPARYDPEELLVASLSSCHMLWYLHLAAVAGVVVTAYRDRADGRLVLDKNGSGRFSEVVLRPEVTITQGSDGERARALHEDAHRLCFIAASMNFPVRVEPVIRRA
jgi:organic hydroperoxide reductase OsmC/OhrA